MPKLLQLELDRRAKTPLAEQIRKGISNAIETGVLASGARLPSWQDLAAQLGVARGTVRSAYEKLSAAQLIVASRATGTRVADRPSITRSAGPTARSRLVHGDVSGDDRRAGDLPDGRGRAGHFSRHALRQDPLTRRSRGIVRGALVPGPSRRTGPAARDS